jgi:AbrB family looped-hinge helix DNA binding protein
MITLPAHLRRELDIAPGDAIEITIEGGQATLRKVSEAPTPELRGLLADYFADREEIQRFVDKERSGWEE